MKLLKDATIYIIIFILISSVLYFFLSNKRKENEKVYLNQKIEKASAEFKATLNGYDMIIYFVYKRYMYDPEVVAVLSKAYRDRKDLDRLRKRLYLLLKPLYSDLKRYQIKYFRFYFPDGTTFIRFHRPDKFGDRPEKEKFSIFDLGKNHSERDTVGFKYTFPVTDGKILIGNVEFTLPFSAVRVEMRKIFKGEYNFLIIKDLIFSKDFSEEKQNYIQSEIDPDFYYEEDPEFRVVRWNIPEEIISSINIKIREKVKGNLEDFRPKSIAVDINGDYYIASFIPISNKKEKYIGYLVYYEKDNTYGVFKNTFIISYVGINLLVGLLLTMSFILGVIKERFRAMAEIDTLTGIYNKGKFNNIVKVELDRSKRYGRPLSLILFDIDHFKKINDAFGHQVGDYVLKTLAQIVSSKIRSTDFFARWGGEEFVILAPETDLEGAQILAEKIRKAIEEYPFETVGKVTSSFGVTEAYGNDSVDSFIKRADAALYKAKDKGRNRVEIELPADIYSDKI
ncbi:GGDEF domain-containing protein [Persephonella sp.]